MVATPATAAPAATASSDPAVILETVNLSRNFGGLRAVSDVSLRIRKGTIHGLIGPNGAGKTTLINLLTGVVKPSSGDVYLNGRRISGRTPHRIARLGVSRTFQTPVLMNDRSVLDNVTVGRHHKTSYGFPYGVVYTPKSRRVDDQQREFAFSVLKQLGLASVADMLAGELPSGMRRLTEVGRALASEPAVLLLDEPAAGMEAGDITKLGEVLRSAVDRSGLAVILIEHNVGFVFGTVDEATVLANGSVLETGTPGQLRTSATVIEAFLGERAGQGANRA